MFPLGSAPVKLFNICSSSLIFPAILLCRYDWFHFADEKPEAQRGGVTHRRSHKLYVRELGIRPEWWFFSVSLLCWSFGVMLSPIGDRGYLSLSSAWPECWRELTAGKQGQLMVSVALG